MRPRGLLPALFAFAFAVPALAEETAPPAEPPAITPEEIEALRQRIRQLETQMDQTVHGAESETAVEEIPLDLETKVHGYADTTLRSYLSPKKERPLTFRLGSMVLSYDANLDRKVFFNTELFFEALDSDTFLRIERVQMQVNISDRLHVEAGKMYTPLLNQSKDGLSGAYRFLGVTMPETQEPEHSDPTLPTHTIGARATGTLPLNYWQLHYALEVSNGRSGVSDAMPHLWDYDWGKAILLGTWVESPGGLTFGAAGYFDPINATPEYIPDGGSGLEEDAIEVIVAPRVMYKGPRLNVLAEAFFIYHADADDPGEGVMSPNGYLEASYKVRKTAPYLRVENNHRRWDSVVYNKLSWPHMMQRAAVGFRYDFAVHAALKAEGAWTYEYDYLSETGEDDVKVYDGSYDVRKVNPSLLVQLAAGF